jgi:2-polyprenyl-3-methyl-5-hydroxy-6-metoxy-1,4-benzoquinol methylase
MEMINHCPICGNQSFSEVLSGKDHFLSGEQFMIVRCSNCNFRLTSPRPSSDEISRYYESGEYIAHNAARSDPFTLLYRIVRNYTIRQKFKLVRTNTTGENLMDIGCGTGEFLNYCSGKGLKVTGIEPNEQARKFARENFSLDIHDQDFLETLEKDSMDVVAMWHVLEHVGNLEERMNQVSLILRPGGTLVLALPNSDSWDAGFYKEYWAAYDLPRHLYHFTPESVLKLAGKFNFSPEKIIPMKFDAFYISLLSEKYKCGKKNYFKALINGFKSNNFGRGHNNNYSSLIYLLKNAKTAK